MGCGKSKDAIATENSINTSKSNKKEDVVETTTNENTTAPNTTSKSNKKEDVVETTTAPNTLVEEKGESKKDEEINKVVEKVGEVGEIKKEEVEGGAKEETKSENIVATNEKVIGVGGSEKAKDVVEEKGLGEEAKMETTNDFGEPLKEKEEKEKEAPVPTIDTENPPVAIDAATPTTASEEEKTLVTNQEIVPGSPASEPKTT